MTILDQIKGRVAYYVDLWQREPRETSQSINTLLTFGGTVQRIKTLLITCKDCKHGHMTTDGEHCKWCSIMATHQIDSDEDVDPPNGYDPEPYFDADFFCGFAERRDS